MPTVVLIYDHDPASLAWWKRNRVRSVVYDGRYWVELRPGADRVVRTGWPVHDMMAEADEDPGWAGRIERVHGSHVQTVETEGGVPAIDGQLTAVALASIAFFATPYAWQGVAAVTILLCTIMWLHTAPRLLGCVWQAKEALGVTAPWVVTVRQLHKMAAGMERSA